MSWTPNKIAKWHKKTFPNATLESQLLKLEEESKELVEARNSDSAKYFEELADVVIVATVLKIRFNSKLAERFFEIDIAYNPKTPFGKIVDKKMDINAKRKWKFENGVYRHEDIK